MNTIDFIVCLVLALAVWNGWRKGFIVQAGSLIALVAGLWLAVHYGAAVGEWLKFDPLVQFVGGFIVLLLGCILAVAVVGRLLKRLSSFAGFGWLDTVLGIGISVLKYMLVVSVLFAALDKLNVGHWLVSSRTIETSKSYKPVLRLSGLIFPLAEQVGGQLPQTDEKQDA
ncbi:MAG: CvpA family protein [Alistipes sp.]|nr:CvpA family protein [Alistipes sp.]